MNGIWSDFQFENISLTPLWRMIMCAGGNLGVFFQVWKIIYWWVMVGRGMREGKHLEIMEDWCWGWSSDALATWCKEMTHWERLWCWERLKAGGEGDERGWDVWMALQNWWTWVWAISRSWWWTGKPGVLQSMGLQRIARVYEWLNWTELNRNHQIRYDRSWPKWKC